MADTPEGGASGSGTNNNPPKAIASLAKKQSDVTRLGAQKLKFVPTLPARRKKDDGSEAAPTPSTSTPDNGRGRGRGVDRGGRGRGRGRGTGVPNAGEGRGAGRGAFSSVEMTASGPFALGPSMAGTSTRRVAPPRSNFTPTIPHGQGGVVKLGEGLTKTAAPTLADAGKEINQESGLGKIEKKDEENDDVEVYSEADDGVEIIDLEDVGKLDWMAPEGIRRERRSKKKKDKLKKEDTDAKGKARADIMEVDKEAPPKEEANLANALDLSESEGEEELEEAASAFGFDLHDIPGSSYLGQDQLFLFQFPKPFPTFFSPTGPTPGTGDAENPTSQQGTTATTTISPETASPTTATASTSKKVKFAENTKPPGPGGTPAPPESGQTETENSAATEPKVSGEIGQLEIYESGAVKMRLRNGILMDVAPATKPSFLQHAVHMDTTNKLICVLGEVNQRFIVTPDISALLEHLEIAERPIVNPDLEDGLIRMDTD